MTASDATAHARDLAALRERAEVAEAKVAAAAVEALDDLERRMGSPRRTEGTPYGERLAWGSAVARLRAALADRPAGGEGR